eukprot:g2052.t1
MTLVSTLTATIIGENGLVCSGNGNMEGVMCDCFDGFSGPTCEKRDCPTGPAWADIATADDTAHGPAECSNMGYCDYTVGVCMCMAGFEGQACERMSCPLSCNNFGKCMSIQRFAALPKHGMDYTDVWDARRIYGCECDDGHQSYDCFDTRVCPTGDDPMTTDDENEVQYFKCDVEDTEAKKTYFHICWKGECTSPINWNDDVSTVSQKINALTTITDSDKTDNLPGVFVSFQTSDTPYACGGYTETVDPWYERPPQIIKVEFKKDFGDLPPLEFVFPRALTAAQTPSITLACRTLSLYKGHLCAHTFLTNHEHVIYVAVMGTKENLVCSGRGICAASKTCVCDANFQSSNGEGAPGNRGDCGALVSATPFDCVGEMPCSLKGLCSAAPEYVCQCNSAYGGADCSEMTCPLGRAWFDAPADNNVAHSLAECSNRGFCDFSSGVCTCQPGFVGAACDILDCPTSPETIGLGLECSGHGNCLFMSDLATHANDNGVPIDVVYGTFPNNPLTWDADKIKGCHCNEGWFGIDCAKRMCPHGDNPDTSGVNEVQTITCEATLWRDVSYDPLEAQRCVVQNTDNSWEFDESAMIWNGHVDLDTAIATCMSDTSCGGVEVMTDSQGVQTISTYQNVRVSHTYSASAAVLEKYEVVDCSATFSFRGEDTASVSVAEITESTLASVETWLEGLPTLTDVTLSLADDTKPLCPYVVGESNTLTITYERDFGDLPEIQIKPSLQYGVDFVVSTVQDCTREWTECSDRGMCDHTVGVCTCLPGYISSDGNGQRGTIQDCGHRSPFALAMESEGGGEE